MACPPTGHPSRCTRRRNTTKSPRRRLCTRRTTTSTSPCKRPVQDLQRNTQFVPLSTADLLQLANLWTAQVVVGGAGLIFNPPQVSAAVGDVVHFVMLAKNHTVTQSSFAKPCVRLATGVDSGFLPNEANDTASAPTFMVTVDSSEPTWWYCRQRQPTPHCGSGMVFAINPTADKSFDAFRRMAIQQNGTDAPPPPPQGGGGGKGTVTLSVDNSGLPPPPPTATQDAGRPAQTVLAPGWNNGGNPSACNCACFCGAAAFPAGSGIGSYGGYGGSMPAPWG